MKKNERVLVLNKNYEAVRICSIFDGIDKVYQGKAYFLDENFQRYDFEEWIDYSREHEKDLTQKIYGVTFFICRPVVILMKVYIKNVGMRVTRQGIIDRDGHICQYCGERITGKRLTIDHVYPKSKGGKMKWENVVVSCWKCNNKKGNRLLKSCGMKLIREPKAPSIIDLFLGLNNGKYDWLKKLEVQK